jgi:hypothetical protein
MQSDELVRALEEMRAAYKTMGEAEADLAGAKYRLKKSIDRSKRR